MSAKDIQFFDSKEKRRGEKDTKILLDGNGKTMDLRKTQ